MAYENDTDQAETAFYEEKANERVGDPMPLVADAVQEARQMVAVTRGAAPADLAQQVTYAKAMAASTFGVPAHLRNNPGACLAIVDISQRTGLSAFMLAQHSYVESDKLAFDSQAVHALIETSGQLTGRLRASYEGKIEDGTRRCIVIGMLKGERVPHVHEGGMLKDLHPGHSDKKDRQGRPYVRGSQLWDRKPDVQLFYDACRDWVRMHAPTALLGAYDRDELVEYAGAAEAAREVNPAEANVLHRLPGTQKGEGFNHASANAELDQIVGHTGGAKTVEPAKPEKKKAAAEKKPAGKQSVTASAIPQPQQADEYLVFARNWIGKVKNPDDALARWDAEREMRDECKVPIKMQKQLEDLIAERFPA